MVYQICIDFINQFGIKSYVFAQSLDSKLKFDTFELNKHAYVGNHTLIHKSIEGAQLTLNLVDPWL